jgi:hypothetical protein
VHAQLTFIADPETGSLRTRGPVQVFEIADAKLLAELASYFPTLGKDSDISGGWMAGYIILLTRPDKSQIKILLSPQADTWSDGAGDWPVKPGLHNLLIAIQKNKTPASSSIAAPSQ